MAQVPINTLYQRFRKGLKPLAQHFWDVFDSYWHKDESIPSAKIDGLQTLLNNKMDKKAVVTADQVGIYDPAKNYVYDAQTAEYVSFSNPSSPNEQFKTEKFYRIKEDAPAGENPETHPAHWAYQGTTIGEITIDDVVGLQEELDDIRKNEISRHRATVSIVSNNIDADWQNKNELINKNRVAITADTTFSFLQYISAEYGTFKVAISNSAQLTFLAPTNYTIVSDFGGAIFSPDNGIYTFSVNFSHEDKEIEVLTTAALS